MINLISPINQLGYGIVGLNIAKELNNTCGVSLWPIGQPSVTTQEDADLVSSMIQNSRTPDFSAPCIRIWHQHDMAQFVGKTLHVGFPIFELDEFNDLEKHHLSGLDKIFVCSEWAKMIILNEIDIDEDNVHVIPLGVDSNIFKPSTSVPPDPSRLSKRPLTFFNCGKWEVRKGHDILVTAFNEAFTEEDNVELWMMCDNPFFSESELSEWIGLYKGSKLGKKIRVISRVESQEEVYNIMKQVDCGVFPSRAEGWNLELLEMMACGKHVIATNYSAHTEFCDANNSILIEPEETELAYDGKWFHGKCGRWLKITDNQITQISNAMKHVSAMHSEQKLETNQCGLDTAHKYNWKSSANRIKEALNGYI